jgi:hypothetical protein
MGVSVPQPFKTKISGSMGSVGPVSVSGIPNTYYINIDKIPKIQLGVDPLTINPIKVTLDPIDLNLAIKEIPNVRGHLPADFSVGLSLLGIEILCMHLCGEAQVITEPYLPNPCERCGRVTTPSTPGVAAHVLAVEQRTPMGSK